jgi:hypothetical protein
MEHIEKNTGGSWVVYRQDDNGKRFIVRAGLGHDEAVRLADEQGARGHKQVYWIEPAKGWSLTESRDENN